MYKGFVIEIIINTIAKPMQIGFYKNKKLIDIKEYEGLTSDILLPILKDILNKYEIKKIIYTNGPGSHMSTKITFVLLKTLNIINGIPINSISAFALNSNKPIKALGKLYFVKEKETIITKKIEDKIDSRFFMPTSLIDIKINKNIEPEYKISAI